MSSRLLVLPIALCIFYANACAEFRAPKLPITPDPAPKILPRPCGTPVETTPPDYPIRALRKAQTGWVLVEFDVTADGAVTNVEVVESSPAGVFEDSTVRAVRKTRFRASDKRRDDCKQLIEFNVGHWSG